MRSSVVIVGSGPRGLSILERILSVFHDDPSPLDVHLVDPRPSGSGVHDPEQPDYLLMNTVAGQVSLFRDGDPAATGRPARGPSLDEWAGVEPGTYLSRAALGRYLAYCHKLIVAQAPPTVDVHERRSTVRRMEPDGTGGWHVHLSDGGTLRADFVFLATGHGTNQPSAADLQLAAFAETHAARNPALRYLRTCYPLDRLDAVAPGASVGVRGMGLSAIDVVATLTEGRGGRFVPARTPGGLAYRPSGAEPRIHVYSRSSRLFRARGRDQKGPDGAVEAAFLTADRVLDLHEKRGRLDFERDVLPLLLADMRLAAGRHPDVVAGEVDALLDPRAPAGPAGADEHARAARGFLAADLARAERGNVDDPVKAAGDALRDIRDEVRLAVERRALTPESHQRFAHTWAPLINGASAGPPRWRSAEWIALIDAGVLRPAGGPGARAEPDPSTATYLIRDEHPSRPPVRCDVLVGAAVDTFRPDQDASPLARSLVAAGYMRPFRNAWFQPGGADVDRAGRLVRASGAVVPNVCAVGHLTEGAHWFTNMLPAPGVPSRVTADAAASVAALVGHLHDAGRISSRRHGPQEVGTR